MKTKNLTWQEMVAHARKNSPFYKEYYSQAPGQIKTLSELPLLDVNKFKDSNHVTGGTVNAAPIGNALVFRSGGTTSKPKLSLFSFHEWEVSMTAVGKGFVAGGLAEGDLVANCGYCGDLYATFVYYYDAIVRAPVKVPQFPLARTNDLAKLLSVINDFKINVLMGTATPLSMLIRYYGENRKEYPDVKIEKVFFSGESLFADQRKAMTDACPGLKIMSAGHTGVDIGLMGYADAECGINEHREFSDEAVLEILDNDTNEVITEAGKPGKLVVTSLVRTLTPVIRYPVGDLCQWVDPKPGPYRKYLLLGRVPEAWSIATASYTYQDVKDVIDTFDPKWRVLGFQIYLHRVEGKDKLIIRVGTESKVASPEECSRLALEKLFHFMPLLKKMLYETLIQPIEFEWLLINQLATNQRTGKLVRILDERR